MRKQLISFAQVIKLVKYQAQGGYPNPPSPCVPPCAYLSAALPCCFRCNWCRNFAAVSWIE